MNSLKKEIDSGLHRAYDELNLKNPEYSLAGGKEYAMRVNFPTTYDVISMAGAEWVRYYLTGQFEVTTYVTPLTKTDCLSIEFNFTNNAYDEKYERKWKAAAQADLEKVLSSIRLTPNPAQSPAGSGK